MISPSVDPPGTANPAGIARIPTGARVFLILSAALMPLALIAFFASLQTTRTADLEVRAQLRVAAAESARALAIELVGDMTALRIAANAFAADAGDAPACARVQGIFAQQSTAGARFALWHGDGRLLCGEEAPAFAGVRRTNAAGVIEARALDDGLLLHLTSRDGDIFAAAWFPTALLRVIARPTGFAPDHGSSIRIGGDQVVLRALDGFRRTERQIVPIGLAGLDLSMTMASAPITSPVLVSMLLPLLMWLAAAGIAWFVVDRLLIRPLRRLQTGVGAYSPGEDFRRVDYGVVPAQEIRRLGETFEDITRTVRLHEADLAAGLVRQTKLTREVHHRVKNNLQVIASLINFHARGAPTPEASAAYASIQRRVDALAVVHRYHFAELEENHGVELRSVIGELASNLRATAPPGTRLGIVLEIEPYAVNQDAAVAVAFLVTEICELAMQAQDAAAIRITLRAGEQAEQAVLRVSSPALIAGPQLDALLENRYGRVIAGLGRQLRSPLHHDPLVGAYEIAISVLPPA
jgi:two-component system, sensor histidine kinase PdtaS